MSKPKRDPWPRFLAVAALAIAFRLGVLAWLALPHGGLAEAMCQFDCGWYERIARAGYGADAQWGDHGSLPHWVFFPLYPALLRMSAELLPARLAGIGLSAAFLFLFLAAGLAHLRATRRVVSPYAWLGLVLCIPTGLFFTALYTESLFAFLATASLATVATRPWLAATAAALASATRPTGVLLAPVIAINRLAVLRRGWPVKAPQALKLLAPVALAPLGLVLFSLAQWVAVGDPLAFSHQQYLWHRAWTGPWNTIPAGLAAMDWANLFARPSLGWEAAWALLGLAAATWLARRRRWGEAWFLAACVLLPASTGLDSLPRFVATNPVFLFAAHDVLAGRPFVALLVCAAMAGLFVPAVLGWMMGAGGIF